jgi:RNA polymerase sigma factor (sigma-70 family)
MTSPGFEGAPVVDERAHTFIAAPAAPPDLIGNCIPRPKSRPRTPEECVRIVDGIRRGDSGAAAELYDTLEDLHQRFRSALGPQEADDRYHDLLLAIVEGIRGGALREPSRLLAYAYGIAGNLMAAGMRHLCRSRQCLSTNASFRLTDPSPCPERLAIEHDSRSIARRVLAAMGKRDRELLVRFYLEEQPASRICQEMRLSETQFRLQKSRAKARLSTLLERRLGAARATRREQLRSA